MHSGKDIKDFSFFGADEEEVLLSPQSRFIVTSEEPYVGHDGYTYIDLLETQAPEAEDYSRNHQYNPLCTSVENSARKCRSTRLSFSVR